MADYESARAPPPRFGQNRPETFGFKFNASKCLHHVRKAVSGSIALRKDKAKKAVEKAQAARDEARKIVITPGEGLSLANLLRKSMGADEQEIEAPPLTDCQRAKDAHDRCSNDNPVGSHGFQNCCRALAGFLFACMEDSVMLPPHLRSLYAPSYAHYCSAEGHAELPPDFATGFVAQRYSEFYQDRQVAEDDACDLNALGGVKEEGNHQIVGIYTASHFLIATCNTAAHLLRGREG